MRLIFYAMPNKIGLDVAIEALREGWRAKRFTMDELWAAAKICRVHSIIQPYVEALSSEEKTAR